MYNFNYHNNFLGIFTQCVVIVMMIFMLGLLYNQSLSSEMLKENPYIMLIFVAIASIFIIIALLQLIKLLKHRSVMKQLNNYGKLVKNLPYTLKEVAQIGTSNGHKLHCMVAEYQLPDGQTVKFVSEPQYDIRVDYSDNLVDVVYDENDPSKYFVDFEINRLSGNLPSDYYQIPPQNIEHEYINYEKDQ